MSQPFQMIQMRAWYNPPQDEAVLVARTTTRQGRRWNMRGQYAVTVYDPRVLPLANDTVQGIYRMHLIDRCDTCRVNATLPTIQHGPAA